GGDDDVDLVLGEALGDAGEELGRVRAEMQRALQGQGDADGAGAAGGEAAGGGSGAVAETAGGLGYAGARPLVDFGKAVEGAAHGRLREPQLIGQGFEFHNQISSHPRLSGRSFGGMSPPRVRHSKRFGKSLQPVWKMNVY